MRTIENVVDFSELCLFAEQAGLAGYNEANDLLYKDAHPTPEGHNREVSLYELANYADSYEARAREILMKYMEMYDVTYITVTAG